VLSPTIFSISWVLVGDNSNKGKKPNIRKHLKRIKNLTIRARNCKFLAAGNITKSGESKRKEIVHTTEIPVTFVRNN
jgi:hypothetical protein